MISALGVERNQNKVFGLAVLLTGKKRKEEENSRDKLETVLSQLLLASLERRRPAPAEFGLAIMKKYTKNVKIFAKAVLI